MEYIQLNGWVKRRLNHAPMTPLDARKLPSITPNPVIWSYLGTNFTVSCQHAQDGQLNVMGSLKIRLENSGAADRHQHAHSR